MSIATLLSAVFAGDPVVVAPGSASFYDESAAISDVIKTMDFAARAEMAYSAPPLSLDAAFWAAERLYRACQFLVYREIEADEVRADFAVVCPVDRSAAVCYSVDLVFRYLPDLFALARGIAREDPLVAGLLELARAWPLSSVGMSDLGDVKVDALIGDLSLRRLYADRIIAREDCSRLNDPAVVQAVREAIGAFPSLAPKIWSAIMPASVPKLESKHE